MHSTFSWLYKSSHKRTTSSGFLPNLSVRKSDLWFVWFACKWNLVRWPCHNQPFHRSCFGSWKCVQHDSQYSEYGRLFSCNRVGKYSTIVYKYTENYQSVNSMKHVIPLHSLYRSIHTKDESKRGIAFAFIFGVN